MFTHVYITKSTGQGNHRLYFAGLRNDNHDKVDKVKRYKYFKDAYQYAKELAKEKEFNIIKDY